MNRDFILDLLELINRAKSSPDSDKAPGNTYFLGDDKVLCCERTLGEGRYPYCEDGLVVWLHTTGFIDACESKFNIFKAANFGEESPVMFFGGLKNEDGTYFPVSVTGAGRQLFENGVSRYIVYSLKCAYCIADAGDVVFALRLHVDGKKHIRFTLSAVNRTEEKREIYLSSFMEAILRNAESEGFWSRMSKFGKYEGDGKFILKSQNATPDMLVINRKLVCGKAEEEYHTASRSDFLGVRGLAAANALSLKEGKFQRQCENVTTTDLPVAAEIIRMTLEPQGEASVYYDLAVCHEEKSAKAHLDSIIDTEAVERELEAAEAKERSDFDNLSICFDSWKDDKITSSSFNKFLRCVQKQTSFCAHGKNYAGSYLGIRDVFQQLEGALIWQRELSREKMLAAMNYILSTGRAPRMFSVPQSPDAPIPVDLEKYIDQGVWIISTFYTYLAYTGDWAVLDEVCDYIDAPDGAWVDAHKTGERTTVLEHLLRITEYLLSNIDDEYTGCLKVLFGDWNDAVDGLGHTKDEGKEFGTGVTVMATLQFRRNLMEMTEILSRLGGYEAEIEKYKKAITRIEEGLEKYAIDEKNGRRRIIHGWGDKVSYKVGSFCDPDGVERYSLTPNAFWAITGFIDRDPSLKGAIMDCIDAVSSKYGLKTFDKPFPKGLEGVGRISNIVPGTYENCCAYAHGSLFGTMALFEIGESKRAWEEIEKTVVITHENATMTSFVMPNSYCENKEYGMDGESLGDWHTGSGCVLIKETVRCAFGIFPTLDGVFIRFPAYFPAKKGKIELRVKDSLITLVYEDKGAGKRSIDISGASEIKESVSSLMGVPVRFIPESAMGEHITVTVTE